MVKNALDLLLTGNEPGLQLIAEHHGSKSADDFISKYNNSCLQLAALEQDVITALQENQKRFLCPTENFSELTH